jgi:hypothetical protein
MQKGTATEGAACKVTSGPNKGKTGTYTRDDDGSLWCEGTWGGTECTGDKCSDARAGVGVFESVDHGGNLVYEVAGVVEVEGVGVFDCVAAIDAASGEGRSVTALPIAGTPLDDLRKSRSKVERMAGEAIAAHLKVGAGA